MHLRRRGLQRPTLDAMRSSASQNLNNSAQFGVVASGTADANVNSIPPGLNLSSRASGVLAGGGGNAPTGAAPKKRLSASYVVSDSGGTLTLGTAYHVSSHGVREFQEPHDKQQLLRHESSSSHSDNLSRSAYALELPASSSSSISCRHISELDFDNGTQIGRGSSGKVYNVLHVPSGIRVCVKQMLIDDVRHRAEVKRELDSLHKAPSRYIVDFYGAFFHEDLGVILLVIELMEGSLLEVIQRKGRLTEAEAKAFAFQVIHGLSNLHSNMHLIHRDIKPANLLYHRSGQVKITDFGVSSGQRSQDPASVHTFVGSILYMSPERLEAHGYGYESDIWSLGITLCEALTGFHPYQDEIGTDAMPLTFWGLLQKVMVRDEERHRSPLRTAIRRHHATTAQRPIAQQSSSISSPRALPLQESDFSDEADDFIRRCMAFERTERASANSLRDHPWFLNYTLKDSEAVIRQLAQDVAAMRAQQTGNAIVALPTAVDGPLGSKPSSDVTSSVQLFHFNTPAAAQSSSRGSTPTCPTPSKTMLSPPPAGSTPSSLTPDETRKKSELLLSSLLDSVKKPS